MTSASLMKTRCHIARADRALYSLVVGIDLPEAPYWMPLFLILDDGCLLDDTMRDTLTRRLRHEPSPRHVPDDMIAASAIPHTRTGKKTEGPVKRILAGARLGRRQPRRR